MSRRECMGIVELEEMPERIRSIGYRQGRRLDFTEREVFERRPQRSRQFAEAYVFECCCPRSLHDRKAPPWIVLGAVARTQADHESSRAVCAGTAPKPAEVVSVSIDTLLSQALCQLKSLTGGNGSIKEVDGLDVQQPCAI